MNSTTAKRDEASVPGWFNQELVRAQGALYGYACALLAGSRDTWDVLQNSNRVMCEKIGEVTSPEGFMPWAFSVVRFQVMAHRKRVSRDRRVFDSPIFDEIAADAAACQAAFSDRVAALEACLQKLPPRQQAFLALRYTDGLAVREIASRLKRDENAIAAALYRARLALSGCIKLALGRENVP